METFVLKRKGIIVFTGTQEACNAKRTHGYSSQLWDELTIESEAPETGDTEKKEETLSQASTEIKKEEIPLTPAEEIPLAMTEEFKNKVFELSPEEKLLSEFKSKFSKIQLIVMDIIKIINE